MLGYLTVKSHCAEVLAHRLLYACTRCHKPAIKDWKPESEMRELTVERNEIGIKEARGGSSHR